MYNLSPLTTPELIDLHDTLEQLGNQLLQLKDVRAFPEDECVDLEDLLEAIGNELLARAYEDQETIPEHRDD